MSIAKYKHWMVRFDNDGESYNGFKWNPVGEWTVAPDWDPKPVCGGGLFGQGPGGFGLVKAGTRFVFCETTEPVVVNGAEVKVEAARIVAVDEEAWKLLAEVTGGVFPGSLNLSRYRKLIPESITGCGGYCILRDYNHELPNNFTHCDGDLLLRGYRRRLPKGFWSCDGDLFLNDHRHRLPNSFIYCGGIAHLQGYRYKLPRSFQSCGGLQLGGYNHRLPTSFTHCDGVLLLGGYIQQLPDSFTYCGGRLDLWGYKHELPVNFKANKGVWRERNNS